MREAGLDPEAFDPVAYLAVNPDLDQAGLVTREQATYHYATVGHSEQRPLEFSDEDFDDASFLLLNRARAADAPTRWHVPQFSFDEGASIPELASLVLGRRVAEREGNAMRSFGEADPSGFFSGLIRSSEFRSSERTLETLDPEELVRRLYLAIESRLPNPAEVDSLLTLIDCQAISRSRLCLEMLTGRLHSMGGQPDAGHQSPSFLDQTKPTSADESQLSFHLLGTGRMVSRADWDDRCRVVGIEPTKQGPGFVGSLEQVKQSAHARMSEMGYEAKASVLCSLYKSEPYLESFLANLLSQSAFARMQLCLVLVDPSELELALCSDLEGTFPNVSLSVHAERIGIYEAWNVGLDMAVAPYITNANADDLRRLDSVELQIRALDQNPWVDVVYQDVLYTLDRRLPWSDLERIGFRTRLPHVTPSAMFAGINCPHNAPMWRAALHIELGSFDSRYQSAGDLEFWLRCLEVDKQFLKTREAHVAYFVNPRGLSTIAGGHGVAESARVLDRYWNLTAYGSAPSYAERPDVAHSPRSRAERLTTGVLTLATALRTAEGVT
jgi:hypothetical protein